jgi:hypothetical protein
MRTFRKVCRWLHRELGFLAVGLTLVYAISGVAVNHVRHWDPNYSRSVETSRIEPPGPGPTTEVVPVVLAALALDEPVKNTWRADEGVLRVFVEGAQLDVDLVTGEVERRGFARRPLLNDVNFLHLNSPKGTARTVWTWIADAYCVVLVILALSGLFLVKGRKGLVGRGGVWTAVGILLPIVFVVLVR